MGNWRKALILVMLMSFLAGLGLFLYPYLHGAMLDRAVSVRAESFLELVAPTDPAPSHPMQEDPGKEEEPMEHEALWNAVNSYNRQIWEDRQADLADPWAYQQPSFTLGDFGLEDETFAVISIPKIGLEMPIFLGATSDHLSAGAAHLTQTSLPVGGSNTNCVLAGHRGWHGGKYFYNIVSLEPGDEVQITNLWGTLLYRVRETKIIESYEVEKIKIQPDQDMLTLLTCYYGSSHKMRFAVFCERVYEGTAEKER